MRRNMTLGVARRGRVYWRYLSKNELHENSETKWNENIYEKFSEETENTLVEDDEKTLNVVERRKKRARKEYLCMVDTTELRPLLLTIGGIESYST